MFHAGDLQSGIARAIQEQKVVVCFVCDDSTESAIWEKEWLQNGWVSSLLEQKAVLLRIQAGSNEQGFLAAFCPMEMTPTLVLIENGQLQEQLVAGISRDDFINSIRKALGANPIPGVSSSPKPTPAQNETAPNTTTQSPPANTAPPATIPDPPTTTTSSSSSIPDEQHIPVSPILPPSSKSKGKQKAAPPDHQSSGTVTAAALAARDALRKKKQEEKEELARIQARIEADKAERKAQAEARRVERERERLAASSSNTDAVDTSSSAAAVHASTRNNKGSQAKEVHLNVRLFDGRTVRSTFPRTATLQSDVRPWLDAEFAKTPDAEHPGQTQKHPPYFFKQILAPLPSRELSAKEESETLGDVELAPSATLVLVPVKGFSEAYAGNGGGVVGGVVGGVTGLVGGVFGLASSALGLVGRAVGSVLGGSGSTGSASSEGAAAAEGGRRAAEGGGEARTGTGERSTNAGGVRVRTLADREQREGRRQEFYNGNQLSFEPNEDDPGNRR